MDKHDALKLIIDASLAYPKLGWEQANALTDFQGKIMKRPGGSYNNFVEALSAIGLNRDEARDAFIDARKHLREASEQKDAKRGSRAAAKPSAIPQTPQPDPAQRASPTGPVVCPRPDAPAPQRNHGAAPGRPPEPQRVETAQPRTGRDQGSGSGRTLRGEAGKPSPAVPVNSRADGTKRKAAKAQTTVEQPTLF